MKELIISLSGDGSAVLRSMFDLFDSKTLTAGEAKAIPGGATITLLPMSGRRSISHKTEQAMEFVLGLGGTVAINMVSSYLYEKLKSRKPAVTMTINRRLTEVDAGNITRILDEEIKWERRG
jgi:hypothetical protein